MLQALFRRGQLKALVDVHSQAEGLGGNLSMEEISIIRGALDLTSKIAIAGMTPLEKVRPSTLLVSTWMQHGQAQRASMRVQTLTMISAGCWPSHVPEPAPAKCNQGMLWNILLKRVLNTFASALCTMGYVRACWEAASRQAFQQSSKQPERLDKHVLIAVD